MNPFRISMLLVGLLFLIGCSHAENTNMEVSPKFISSGSEMQGVEGKIGILGPEFVADQVNKHMWHLWGSQDELRGSFKVEAVNMKSREKINPFTVDLPTSIGGPNNGADAHLPSSMKLPEPGIWQLNAYLDNKLFGSINIEVKEALR